MDPIYEKTYNPSCSVSSFGKCSVDADCCESGESCHKKSEHYSQCRPSCPDNADWDCYTGIETIFSGSTTEIAAAGAALLVTVFGGAYALKQLICDCRKKGGRGGEDGDEIDLTTADSNAMFFRNHNAFGEYKKEQQDDRIGDKKL